MGSRGASSSSFKKEMEKKKISENEGLSGGGGGNSVSQKIPASQFQAPEGNKNSVRRTLDKAEKMISKNKYETGIIIDKDGFVVAAYKGKRDSVNFGSEVDKVKGNIITHNHPSGIPLPSTADIKVSGKYGAKEVRMATTHGTGSLKPLTRGGTVADWNGLANAYGKMCGTGVQADKAYNWLVKNAKKYGFSFSVEGKK